MHIIKIFLALSLLLLTALGHSCEETSSSGLKEKLFKETKKGHINHSYRAARIKLFNDIHLERDSKGYYVEGVYCQDKFYRTGNDSPNNRLPDHTSFNTEHTWPQSKFSRRFGKGKQKSDLHHLFPTFNRINSQRGNYPFAEVRSQRDLYCANALIGPAMNGGGVYFEPPDEHKGNVARAMFYFSVRYRMSISSTQEGYLRAWHREDPVDAEERERNEKIYEFQGNRNPFVDRPELVYRIENF